jgi:methylated-DNA-[protein]-cysteine S-methyltransferase
MLDLVIFETVLGWMGLVGTRAGLKQVLLPCRSEVELLQMVKGDYREVKPDGGVFGDLPHRLKHYLAGECINFMDELDISNCTDFRQQVWRVTRAIPYGETRSYSWVSTKLGYGPKASRAVGQALGKNPLPILIPCHRVLSADGTLGGFSAGLELKKHLLRLESSLK